MTVLRAWAWGGDRFLTRTMGVSFVVCGVGLLLLGPFLVHGDGAVYFAFLQRLLGENQPLGVAYQFGSSFSERSSTSWDALWAVARRPSAWLRRQPHS